MCLYLCRSHRDCRRGWHAKLTSPLTLTHSSWCIVCISVSNWIFFTVCLLLGAQLGVLGLRSGNAKDAERYFKKVVQIDPTHTVWILQWFSYMPYADMMYSCNCVCFLLEWSIKTIVNIGVGQRWQHVNAESGNIAEILPSSGPESIVLTSVLASLKTVVDEKFENLCEKEQVLTIGARSWMGCHQGRAVSQSNVFADCAR